MAVVIATCLKLTDLLNIDATNITNSIFTNSPGCTETGPTLRTRLAPYTRLEKSTPINRARPTAQYTHPIFLKLFTFLISHGIKKHIIVDAHAIINCFMHLL